MFQPRKNLRLSRRRRIRSRDERCGAVLVEFAICSSLLFMFFFAALEFSRVNMIRQSIENAVYEGSRRGIVPGATSDDCRTSALTVLNSISVNSAQVTVTPEVITPNTSQVTVAVNVPVNSNSWVTPLFFDGMSISGSMTLNRERFNTSSVP